MDDFWIYRIFKLKGNGHWPRHNPIWSFFIEVIVHGSQWKDWTQGHKEENAVYREKTQWTDLMHGIWGCCPRPWKCK